MDVKIIPVSEMADFAGGLLKLLKVLAPVRRDGVCIYDWLAAPEQLDLTCAIPRISAKDALLPRTEILFRYHLEKDKEEIIPPPAPEPQALLGLHVCDIRAINVLDAVFSAEPAPDQPYLARRALTTLIGRGSLEDVPTAFFLDLGIDPMDNADCDLFLVPLGPERYALEIITDKGRALASAYQRFKNAGSEDLVLIAECRRQSATKVYPPSAAPQATRVKQGFDLEQIRAKLEKIFDSAVWDHAHEKCVGCGVCAFLCPTCHCFDIQEETCGKEGARMRVWDTCQFELFTRHASGHNPRDSQKERARQRIMHKFCYGIGRFKIPFCVGCGRCVSCCPVNNDLRIILKEIQETPDG